MAGGVYKWVDEKGSVHFSDRPLNPQAERVPVEPLVTMKSSDPQRAYAPASSPRDLQEKLQTLAQAQTQEAPRRRPSPADYEFSLVGGFQQGDDVILSGRVAGPACKALRVHVAVNSHSGLTVSGSTVVADVDPGSRLFKFKVPAWYKGAVPRWDVAGVQGVCLD